MTPAVAIVQRRTFQSHTCRSSGWFTIQYLTTPGFSKTFASLYWSSFPSSQLFDSITFFFFYSHQPFIKINLQTLSFASYVGTDAMDIHETPEYPGKIRGPRFREAFAYTESKAVQHNHEGRDVTITFYRLASQRGWVHDFSPERPTKKQMSTIVNPSSQNPVAFKLSPRLLIVFIYLFNSFNSNEPKDL